MKTHVNLFMLFLVAMLLSFPLSGCSSKDDFEDKEYIGETDGQYDEDIADEGEDIEANEDMEEDEQTEDSDTNTVEGNDSDKSDNNTSAQGNKGTQTSKPSGQGAKKNSPLGTAQTLKLQLEAYSLPDIFHMSKPKGWDVYKAGDYHTIAFLTRDEAQPLRQVFLFGQIGLFYVSQSQKNTEISYQNGGGYSVPWIDMPVVSPFDGTGFFNNFNTIMNSNIADGFLGAGNMPIPAGFDGIEIISQKQVDSVLAGLDTYLVQAVLTQNGKAARGLFLVSTYQDGLGHGTAYMVTGITAPSAEFYSAQEALSAVLNSFILEDAYVQQGMQVIAENGEIFKEISQTISETSDIITKGWTERNKTYDVLAEKKSDQIMDVERVYDPVNDVVYEVENGFYDYYKTHDEQYPVKNLQPLPDNAYDLWGQAPRLNHGLVIPK